ncbi:MAG: zinc ribbon domain-containing protein [Acidobacteriota bacterium]
MAEQKNEQIKLLVRLQDLDLMIEEINEVQQLGFDVEGKAQLEKARAELAARLSKPLLYTYERLRARYKRAIVPVKHDTCLGCFMRVPTAVTTRGRSEEEIITCEGCGRILYWLD